MYFLKFFLNRSHSRKGWNFLGSESRDRWVILILNPGLKHILTFVQKLCSNNTYVSKLINFKLYRPYFHDPERDGAPTPKSDCILLWKNKTRFIYIEKQPLKPQHTSFSVACDTRSHEEN